MNARHASRKDYLSSSDDDVQLHQTRFEHPDDSSSSSTSSTGSSGKGRRSLGDGEPDVEPDGRSAGKSSGAAAVQSASTDASVTRDGAIGDPTGRTPLGQPK